MNVSKEEREKLRCYYKHHRDLTPIFDMADRAEAVEAERDAALALVAELEARIETSRDRADAGDDTLANWIADALATRHREGGT